MEDDDRVSREAHHRLCMNKACNVGSWMVSPASQVAALWYVFSEAYGSYVVAACQPLCPCCGTDLHTHLDLEGGISALESTDTGPIFSFLRTLQETV